MQAAQLVGLVVDDEEVAAGLGYPVESDVGRELSRVGVVLEQREQDQVLAKRQLDPSRNQLGGERRVPDIDPVDLVAGSEVDSLGEAVVGVGRQTFPVASPESPGLVA